MVSKCFIGRCYFGLYCYFCRQVQERERIRQEELEYLRQRYLMFYVETNVDYSDTQGLFNQTFTSVAIVFRLFSRTAPSWPVSSVGRALQRYRRGQGFESRTNLNFFRLSFPNYKSCVYNYDDLLSYNSSPRSSHI